MKYITGTTEFEIAEDTVISLGKFDGLHNGHKLLMEYVLAKKEEGLKAVVFTFDIPPRNRVEQEYQKVLTTNEEKMHIFEKIGVDYLIECPFTKEIMEMEAEDFIRMMVEKLHVKCVVTGKDFRFGHQRRGDHKMLEKYAGIYGYEAKIVEKMQWNGRDISSTYVREEIAKGEVQTAEKLLGYPYFIQGTVVHGNQIGRTIGIPTINLQATPNKLLPPFGVYVARVSVNGKLYGGITNVGRKPTVGDDYPVGVETHIFDFDADIYKETVQVEFLHFLRPEFKFESLEDLVEQMQRDCKNGRIFLETEKRL